MGAGDAGELDAQADDPDPMEGFKPQYLNLWPAELWEDPSSWRRIVARVAPEGA